MGNITVVTFSIPKNTKRAESIKSEFKCLDTIIYQYKRMLTFSEILVPVGIRDYVNLIDSNLFLIQRYQEAAGNLSD